MAYPLSSGSVTSLSDILSFTDTVNWLIGATKTGKTSFLLRFIGSLPRGKDIYVLDTSGKFVDNELAQIESVKVLPIDSQLNEECLEKLPPNSFVFVDDFQLLTKTSQWQRVINYCAHHFHLSDFFCRWSLHILAKIKNFAEKCREHMPRANSQRQLLSRSTWTN